MKKINIVLILMTSSFLISCESNTYNEITETTTNPTYTKNIAPIVKANCIGCHSGNSQFPNLETYAEVKESTQNGDLICRIDQSKSCGRVMPQSGPMSQSTIDLFLLWQQQGCLN